MTPVIHCSAGTIHFFPRATFIQQKEIQLTKHKNYNRLTSSSHRFLLPQSSLRLFPIYRSGFFSKHGSRIRSIPAVGADVTVEEPNPAVSGKDAIETTESTTSSVETSESAPTGSNPVLTSAKTKRSRPVRKSEMPPVKDGDLTPGASFTGKVRSVQPFGAFVDFGAFTDGLVHVSRMSDGYVKDVASVVSVGQEVKVRIVEANMETGRISLTMRDSDDARKVQQKRESPAAGSSDRPRSARKNAARSTQKRDEEQKKSNFVKGQVLTGTVKNTIRSGSFVSLPDGEEGFIPVSEESEGFGNVTGNSSLQVGQEVNVRVLRIARGKVTLTMKKEEDVEELNRQLNKGVWHTATNPFELAFRQNKDIASFLDDRERSQKSPEYISLPKNSEEVEDKIDDTITRSDTLIEDGSTLMEELLEETTSAESSSTEPVSGDEVPVNLPRSFNAVPETLSEDSDSSRTLTESSSDSDLAEVPVRNEAQDSSAAVDTCLAKDADSVVDEGKEQDTDTKTVEANEDDSLKAPVVDEVTVTDEVKENDVANAIVSEDEASTETLNSQENSDSADPVTVEDSAGEIGDGILSSQVEVPMEADDSQGDTTLVEEKLDTETPAEVENAVTDAAAEIVSNAIVSGDEASAETLDSQENSDSADIRTVSAGEIGDGILTSQGEVPEEAENTQGDATLVEENLEMETPAEIKNVVTDEVKENDVANAIVSEDNASTATLNSQEKTDPADPITISAGEVGEEIPTSQVEVPDDNQGDAVLLEEKLETEAHVEIENVVTDGVKENDVANAIISEDEASTETLNSQENSDSADRATVYAGEIYDGILTSQVEVPEEADDTQGDATLVDEKLETETPAQVENVVASADLNNAKLVTPDASNGQTGNLEEASTLKATISPALVKQLREETGAGMMDCKKALSETGGDIVKAQEFLRKKGLASADKKASRTTAEGRIGSYIHDGRIGVLIEVSCETDFVSRGEIFKQLVEDLAMQVAACPQVHYLVTEDVPKEIVDKEREIEMQKEDLLSKPENIRSKIVDGRIRKRLEQFALLEQPYIKNDKMVVKDWVKQTIATIGENIKVSRFVRYNLGEGLEKKSQDFAAEVAAQTAAKESPAAPKEPPVETKETVEKPPAIAVSAALVKQLREETGAGMMDCKKALTETGGNLEKAQEYLRKKGLSSADKKSSRLAAEGRISAYVHDSRIGCLIEVNSETDFVARNEKFKELVDDLAMQVVACPQVEFVSVEDIPEDIVNKEKEIEMQREDLKSKPENIREKIVEGRISKRLGELALLEQPFIRSDKVTVKDLVKQTVAALGENIRVRRFVRFTLGETKVES